MNIFGKMGEVFGIRKLDNPLEGMPPIKRAKKLETDLRKEPKVDSDTLLALTKSINIMERTKGDSDALLQEFMQTRDMLMHQPLVWLNLALQVREQCGDRIYEFPDFSIEGKAALVRVHDALAGKSETEKKFFSPMEKLFTKKEVFSDLANTTQTSKSSTESETPIAAHDNLEEQKLDKAA